MKVLIACEESQRVCTAFRDKGHEAFSADIQDPSGGHPEWHYKGDVLAILNGHCTFSTMDGRTHVIDKWDLIIAHPPCTYLTTASATRLFDCNHNIINEDRFRKGKEAAEFFKRFISADCERICVENPLPMRVFGLPLYSQIIEPYWFGDPFTKRTCLWLKGLNLLEPTSVVDPGEILDGGYSVGASANYAVDEQGKILSWNDPRTAKARSKTFPGIAKAMAEQWGDYLLSTSKGD